jgi:hypothetical protein
LEFEAKPKATSVAGQRELHRSDLGKQDPDRGSLGPVAHAA